ncbi:hypothetical protein [Streptomyces gilvosporeus]|uniref:hypothetical protein n=1 Tax=Streptomyces gilvosporeus TaxID=553510 RepID=UPI00131DE860|nr:hypothetical protein [Streptomyces gilvosporeus]
MRRGVEAQLPTHRRRPLPGKGKLTLTDAKLCRYIRIGSVVRRKATGGDHLECSSQKQCGHGMREATATLGPVVAFDGPGAAHRPPTCAMTC